MQLSTAPHNVTAVGKPATTLDIKGGLLLLHTGGRERTNRLEHEELGERPCRDALAPVLATDPIGDEALAVLFPTADVVVGQNSIGAPSG